MRLKTTNSIVCIVAASALVSVAWASDAWKDKKPADWAPKQMNKFMTNSPWSNTVQPDSNMPMSSGSPGGPGGGGWGGGGGGMGGGGRGGGGGMGGGSGAAMPIMTFQIRWLSAPIMREALKASENEQLSAEIEKYANDYYIIGVQRQVEGGAGGSGPKTGGGRGGLGGGQMAGGQQGAGSSQGQGANNEQTQARWQQYQPMPAEGAILKFGHQQVHPDKAEFGPSKTGMMTLYMFPRSLKLEDADKSYMFEVTQGPSTTRASFSLKGFEEAQDKGL
ncbi:MAG: hypothetical protein WBE74_23690 [Terracidiphilus sp.]